MADLLYATAFSLGTIVVAFSGIALLSYLVVSGWCLFHQHVIAPWRYIKALVLAWERCDDEHWKGAFRSLILRVCKKDPELAREILGDVEVKDHDA